MPAGPDIDLADVEPATTLRVGAAAVLVADGGRLAVTVEGTRVGTLPANAPGRPGDAVSVRSVRRKEGEVVGVTIRVVADRPTPAGPEVPRVERRRGAKQKR